MCHQMIIGHVCSEITRASNRLLFPLEKDALLDESRTVNKYHATGQFYCNTPLCVTMHSAILAGVPSFSARQGQKISFSIHGCTS